MLTNNTSDSETDEDTAQIKKLLEATDSTLFNNAMFQKDGVNNNCKVNQKHKLEQSPTRSERTLPDNLVASRSSDLNFDSQVQAHIWRKLSSLIAQQVEEWSPPANIDTTTLEPHESKVRLLNGATCYVQSYDETCDQTPSTAPMTKPTIERRRIAGEPKDKINFANIAVSGETIMAGTDTKHWATRRKRSDKLFEYTADKKGVLWQVQPVNEFTEERRKRKWNETKIKEQLIKHRLAA